MIRYVIAIMLLSATVGSQSCKKEKKNNVVTPIDSPLVITYSDYTMLKPGNYWIYQNYKLDSISATPQPMGTFDSSFVEKDTVIRGRNYHKYCSKQFSSASVYDTYFLRDSLHYIVNSAGYILFSSQDFTNIFRTYTFGPNGATPDTLIVTELMGSKDVNITVEAGTFVTSTFRRVFHFPAGYAFGSTREYDYRYCKNIGLITETTAFFTAGPAVYERRLVRYHVQ